MQSSPLCSNGQVWQELHIVSGDSVSLELSGRGNEFILNCLSGFVWDLLPGSKPKYNLTLYNIDNPTQSTDLTALINNTNWNKPIIITSPISGAWGLMLTNNNLLWNADFTLVIDYFIRPTPISCSVCPPGRSGTFCNETCSSHCYQCCQNNPSLCTVCAAGRSWLPECNATCLPGCLYCDDMAGCHVCANPMYSGPDCTECRPSGCKEPSLTNCMDPCGGFYPFCDACETVLEKAVSIIGGVAQVFEKEELAEAAIAVMELECAFLLPIVDVICEFAVVAVSEGITTRYLISWSGTEVASKLFSKSYCALAHLCPSPEN